MQKNEYLTKLSQALSNLPDKERTDILSDYEEHFVMGMAAGRSEADIAKALGDPRTIGREYAALSFIRQAEVAPSAGGLSRAVIATVGLGLFNLLVVFFPFVMLIFLLVMILIVGFSLFCAGPFLTGYAVLELVGIIQQGMPAPPLPEMTEMFHLRYLIPSR